jgi:2'-5' RNA ligase
MTGSSTESIRAFIAVRPNDAARAGLVRAQGKLKKALAGSGLRIAWTDPETLHITLLFLGDIPAADADRVFQCLEKTAAGFPAIGTSLSGIGLFKKSGALWVGIEASPGLLDLQKALAASLGCGPGLFHAHFTLGRIKAGRADPGFFQCLEKLNVEPVPFAIASAQLVRSELLPDGARHTVLGTAPFR